MDIGLEQLIISTLEPAITEVVDDHCNSAEVIAAMAESLKPHVDERVNEVLAQDEVAENFVKNATDLMKDTVARYLKKIGYSLKTVEVTRYDKIVRSETALYHESFEDVLIISSVGIPVLMKGPAGTGKDIISVQVAEALGLKHYTINSPQDKSEFEGFIDGNGNYHETAFYKAFKEGALLSLTEMDNSIPGALIAVNDAISNGVFPFPCGEVKMHPNFRVIASANTWGTGRDAEYMGRNKIDAATLDRFAAVEVYYDQNLESILYPDEQITEIFWALRAAALRHQIRATFSMRGIGNAYKLSTSNMSKKDIVKATIVKGLSIDDLNILCNRLPINKENPYYIALNDVRAEMKSK